jgi:hypothetical protein
MVKCGDGGGWERRRRRRCVMGFEITSEAAAGAAEIWLGILV